ncbi:MAG: bifunctional DedA family/phosphatase PAP2 family protein [Bacillota bacterium]|nr:bifunctional DedA family/phosphatase PAP2 family protein [Bacillota bacterium]
MIKDILINLVKHYGGIVLFFSLILEYLGLPLPGETMMSFIGFLDWKNQGSAIYLSLIFAISGNFIGSSFAWLIGYKYGEGILLKYGRFVHITKEKLDSTSKSFYKHKLALLLFGRYVPGIRHIVPYLGGVSKMKFNVFSIYNLAGSIIWCTSFIGMGFLMGEKWTTMEMLIKAYSLIFILLIVFVFIVFKFFNKNKKTIFAIAFPTLLFIKLIEDLIRNELSVFDNTIYGYLRKLLSEDMTDFMKLITAIGSGLTLILIALICLYLSRRNKRYSFFSKMTVLNLALVSVLNEAFKVIFHRQRPDILRLVEAGGFSFPSGHSMISMSFYGFIAYLFYANMKSRWKYLVIGMFSVMIVFIGISRIYLGVHYASDVLAGFSAGLAWLAVFVMLVNKIYSVYQRK